jgi:hypothetical protein
MPDEFRDVKRLGKPLDYEELRRALRELCATVDTAEPMAARR